MHGHYIISYMICIVQKNINHKQYKYANKFKDPCIHIYMCAYMYTHTHLEEEICFKDWNASR